MKIHCPRCGQEQVSNQTRFCSRCGFLMTGVGELVANEGVIPERFVQAKSGKNSPKKRGIKQGAIVRLVGTMLIVPLLAVISAEFDISPALVALAAIISFVGGLLRIIYAAMFESSEAADKTLEENVIDTSRRFLNKKQTADALPPQQSIPTSAYIPRTPGQWRDTNDLQPSSVTDHTTKLLEDNRK